jgi:hypothetical protein
VTLLSRVVCAHPDLAQWLVSWYQNHHVLAFGLLEISVCARSQIAVTSGSRPTDTWLLVWRKQFLTHSRNSWCVVDRVFSWGYGVEVRTCYDAATGIVILSSFGLRTLSWVMVSRLRLLLVVWLREVLHVYRVDWATSQSICCCGKSRDKSWVDWLGIAWWTVYSIQTGKIQVLKLIKTVLGELSLSIDKIDSWILSLLELDLRWTISQTGHLECFQCCFVWKGISTSHTILVKTDHVIWCPIPVLSAIKMSLWQFGRCSTSFFQLNWSLVFLCVLLLSASH